MNDLSFSGTGRDRGHALRSDPAALEKLREGGLVLPLMRGLVLADAQSLGWLPADHPLLDGAGAPVFLGFLAGEALFAAQIPGYNPEEGIPDAGVFDAGLQPHPRAPQGRQFTELRRIMSALSPDEAELAATARALCEWHAGNGFCARCGAASLASAAGWQRNCPSCRAIHFPRTDPVVIMLVTRGNQLLLGRSPGWPEGMFSTLAGFIEPGETVEAAVRREVAEETGVSCGAVRYIASQPWPFPASLMLGCHAEAESEAITLDPAELEEALWLSREELVSVLAGSHPRVRPPRAGSIARYLITGWVADRLG